VAQFGGATLSSTSLCIDRHPSPHSLLWRALHQPSSLTYQSATHTLYTGDYTMTPTPNLMTFQRRDCFFDENGNEQCDGLTYTTRIIIGELSVSYNRYKVISIADSNHHRSRHCRRVCSPFPSLLHFGDQEEETNGPNELFHTLSYSHVRPALSDRKRSVESRRSINYLYSTALLPTHTSAEEQLLRSTCRSASATRGAISPRASFYATSFVSAPG
jgi:hypothetical protein